MRFNNFGAGGNIFTKLLQTTCREAGVIICIQFLEGLPLKFRGPKNVQISARFLTTFDFDPKYLRNGSAYRTSEKNLINRNPFHAGQQKFAELWSTNKKVLEVHILTHPSGHFAGDYISALRGCCFLKFLHALEIAHTPTRTGCPPPKKIAKI